MKKIYGIAWLFCLLLWVSSCQAFVFWDKTELQNYRLSNVFLQLSQKSNTEALYIYDELVKKLEKWSLTISSEKTKDTLEEIIWKLELRQKSLTNNLKKVSRHKSLILKFWAGAQSTDFLESKRSEIGNIDSVFIFRTGSTDLPWYQIEAIAAKLKSINPDILIFIDQEWWLINRYVEFDANISFQNYLVTDSYVSDIYNNFSEATKTSLGSVFPSGYSYFPSLTKIWEVYNVISKSDKQSYLDLVAYLRLKTLSDRWINTYWLVMDLDRGNPVIRNYRRSFSSDLESYKRLWDAFIKASKKTWVSLYLKHFPGHGAGQVDSHIWILDYTNYQTYVGENLELFKYMLDNKWYTQMWVMVWHMYVQDTLKSNFSDIISSADYILTDDLAMQWYVQATWWEKSWIFFTTDVVFDSEKAILVDSLVNPQIK